MFVRIRNTPINYAWGTEGEISRLLGTAGACARRTDDGLEAELWLGAHHGAPSQIVDPAETGGAIDLREWIASDPRGTLGPLACGLREGDGARLPFLVKVLAAGSPLSLQAHPSLADARAGFARESELGLPLDAPTRSYKDDSHKPELLLALSETMEALAGFRHRDEVVAVLEQFAAVVDEARRSALGRLTRRVRDADDERGRRDLVAWVLGREPDSVAATEAVVAAARAVDGPATEQPGRDAETVRLLADRYPGDPGVVIALLLNRVTMQRGEALFVGAGSMHAYLRGVGLEVMASSDNVLRGGLTPKHVDVPELLRILDATETLPPYLAPTAREGGAIEFSPGVVDFALTRVTRGGAGGAMEGRSAASVGPIAAGDGPPAMVDTLGPAILLCLSGEARVRGVANETWMRAGEAVYVTPDEARIAIEGACDLLVATAGIAGVNALPIRA